MLLGVSLAALSVWPAYQYRPDHNAVFSQPAIRAQWSTRLGGKINGGLAYADGDIFVETFDHRVSALNARNGAILWSTRVPNVVMTTPIVADHLVIAGTGTAHVLEETASRLIWGRSQGDDVVALDEGTGRVRWMRRTTGEDMPSPVLVKIHGVDAIVFANGDDHIRAWAVRDGHTIWERSVPGIATMSSAAYHDGRVYVVIGGGSHSGGHDRLLAIDPQDGHILWGAPYGNADCSPTIADGVVLVEGSNAQVSRAQPNAFNDVEAVDESTGRLRWQWYSGFGTFTNAGSNEEGIAALAHAGTFYESIPATDQFIAFDAKTGHVRWSIHTAAAVKMSAVEKNGRLYFGDTGRTLYVVDAGSGRVLSRRAFSSFFSVSSPLIFGQTLFVANGQVVRAINLSASPSMQ